MLSDAGGNFYPPTGFTANSATYQCTLNGYKMLVLLLHASIPVGVKAYTLSFSGAQINGTLITDNTIPANIPVLVNGSGAFTFNGSGDIPSLLNPRTGMAPGVYISVKVPLGSYYLKTENGVLSFSRATAQGQPLVNTFNAYLSPAATASGLPVILNDVTLPVGIGLFTLKQIQKEVRLEWKTYSEVNNRGFDVERSADGIRFAKICFVNGKAMLKIGTPLLIVCP